MIHRLWARLCPHCLHDETPLAEHPAIQSLDRTSSRIDRLLALFPPPTYRDDDEDSPLPMPPRWRPKDYN